MLSISRMAMACWWASFLPSYSLHSFRQDLSHDFSFPPLGVTEHKAGQDNHKTGEEGSAELHAAAGDTSALCPLLEMDFIITLLAVVWDCT